MPTKNNFLSALFLLLATAPLCAQNVRVDLAWPSITGQYATPFLVANTPTTGSPVLAVCAHPANQVPCTNYIPTYTQSGVACANGAQDTPQPQPSACQSTGDAQGNIGFWVNPASVDAQGRIDITVCVNNNCGNSPYTLTVPLGGASGSCGAVQVKTGNGILFGEPTIYAEQCAGSDIGAKINAAYAALPSTGGRIHVPATASCQSFSAPILFNTPGKVPILEGDAGGSSCIEYTPTSGISITLDWGQGFNAGGGLQNLTLEGSCATGPSTPCTSGSTAVGLDIGASNGAVGYLIFNSVIGVTGNSFFTSVQTHPNSYIGTFFHTTCVSNGTCWLDVGGGENAVWNGGDVSRNSTAFYFHGSGGDKTIKNISCDDNTAVCLDVSGNYKVVVDKVHFENVGLGTGFYITTGGQAVVDATNSLFQDQRTVGTSTGFVSAQGSLITFANDEFVSAGITVTQAIQATSSTLQLLGGNLFSGVSAAASTTGSPFVDCYSVGETTPVCEFNNWTMYDLGTTFASLPSAPQLGMSKFCTNCLPTTAASCSTATPASCVCKAGTGSMTARYENFMNNGAGWYCH